MVKNPPAKCSRHKKHRFDPSGGKIPWNRTWWPTPESLPGEFCGQSSLVSYSPWGFKGLDMTEHVQARAQVHKHTHAHTHTRWPHPLPQADIRPHQEVSLENTVLHEGKRAKGRPAAPPVLWVGLRASLVRLGPPGSLKNLQGLTNGSLIETKKGEGLYNNQNLDPGRPLSYLQCGNSTNQQLGSHAEPRVQFPVWLDNSAGFLIQALKGRTFPVLEPDLSSPRKTGWVLVWLTAKCSPWP